MLLLVNIYIYDSNNQLATLSWNSNLTHLIDDVLSQSEYLITHWCSTVYLGHANVNSIEHSHYLVGIMSLITSIASDWWWCYTTVSAIEYPVCAECNVCAMKSHSTSNVEIALVYVLAETRQKLHHRLHAATSVVNRIMEILNTELLTELSQFLRRITVAKLYDSLNACLCYCWPCISLMA